MVIMNDVEWSMLSYYVIYYEKLKKVMQRTEKEALVYCNVIAVLQRPWVLDVSVLVTGHWTMLLF